MQNMFTSYFDTLTESQAPNIEDLLAFHSRRFGGYKMEDEPDSEDGEQETEEEPSTEAPVDEQDDTSSEGDEDSDDDEQHELSQKDALKELSKVRREAASWRTKFREAEQSLAKAKTPEEVEEIRNGMTTEWESTERTLIVENVALRNHLPEEFVEDLTTMAENGATREALEAFAKKVAKLAPKEDEEPEGSGGLNPGGDSEDTFDPVAVSRKARRRR